MQTVSAFGYRQKANSGWSIGSTSVSASPCSQSLPSGGVNLIYIDPPFNTGRQQILTQKRTIASAEGDRTGFQGRRYQTTAVGTRTYADTFDDYLGFLAPRLAEAHRVLVENGSLYVHLDYREVHYVKVLLDQIFGRGCFLNEIIWAYDYGGRPKRRWPPKHDNILVYVKDPESYVFNQDAVDRIPYMAPGLVGPEKAHEVRRRPTPGGTPSCRQTARNAPATQPRNRWPS